MATDPTASDPQKADYGIDAPGVVRNFAVGGAAAFIMGIGLSVVLGPSYTALAYIGEFGFFARIGFLLTAALMILSSKVGKFRERDRLLDGIPWRGDEMVLDVGCGRGLMLIGATKRLKRAGRPSVWTYGRAWTSPTTTRRPPSRTLGPRASRIASKSRMATRDDCLSTTTRSTWSSPAWLCTASTTPGDAERRFGGFRGYSEWAAAGHPNLPESR